MRRRLVIIGCTATILLVVFVGAVVIERRTRVGERQRQVFEEFVWTYELLRQDKESDRLHEFLKARLYYWGMLMEPEALARYAKLDYGPVDEQVLGTMLAAPPHADSPNEHYRAMMERVKR